VGVSAGLLLAVATILACGATPTSLAACFQGRVIILTFSDHDHDQADIVLLWQNCIYYTLKNHFAVTL
jgi:hypothetical protein